MRRVRKGIAVVTILMMALGSFNSNLNAEVCCTSTGGCGYEDTICAPSLFPYIILSTALLATIAAIAIRHKGHHQHAHVH